MNNPYIYNDSQKNVLTAEINNVLAKGQGLLADMAIAAGYEKLYFLAQSDPCKRNILYLYLYALESWDSTTDEAQNFMTLLQLKKILSAVEQLFCDCTVNEQTC